MKQKIWFLSGIGCLCAGVLCCGIAAAAGAGNASHYREAQNLTDVTYVPNGQFSSVLMDIAEGDITVQTGDTFAIEAKNVDATQYQTTVENGVLHVELTEKERTWKHWYDYISLGKTTVPNITVTLPDQRYQAVGIACDLGDCTVDGISASTLSLDLDYGNVKLQNVAVAACTVSADFGDVSMDNLAISGKAAFTLQYGLLSGSNLKIGGVLEVKNDLGNVNLTNTSCAAGEMRLDDGNLHLNHYTETDESQQSSFTLDMGNLQCENSTIFGGVFDLELGDMDVTETALFGKTAITMDLGDVSLQLKGSNADYNVGYSYASGSVNENSPNQITITGDVDTMDATVTYTE